MLVRTKHYCSVFTYGTHGKRNIRCLPDNNRNTDAEVEIHCCPASSGPVHKSTTVIIAPRIAGHGPLPLSSLAL